MKTNTQVEKDIVNYAIDKLENLKGCDTHIGDLHNEVFNTDYFIIGYYDAEQWLIKNPGIFNAIEQIREYEQSNFGEVSTDFSSSEKVVNMYVYIQGEVLFSEIRAIQANWDGRLSDEGVYDAILAELKD